MLDQVVHSTHCSLLEKHDESLCPMSSNPEKVTDFKKIETLSSVLAAGRTIEIFSASIHIRVHILAINTNEFNCNSIHMYTSNYCKPLILLVLASIPFIMLWH